MISAQKVDRMETKDIIFGLRTQKGLSQDEQAERVLVTRQAHPLAQTFFCFPLTALTLREYSAPSCAGARF